MAYVSVPKDLTKVKNKVVLNLTKRQIICFAAAAAVGIPFYFVTRDVIGNSSAVMGMVVLMVPAFLFAMYEKDGMPLEKVLMNIITVRFLRPQVRMYETENLFEKEERQMEAVSQRKKRKRKKKVYKKKAASGGRNLGRNMDAVRRQEAWDSGTEKDLNRRNAEAGYHAAGRGGRRNHARQG